MREFLNKCVFNTLALIIMICHAALAQAPSTPLDIALAHDDQAEQQTKQQLQRVLSAYDLSPYFFTRKLIIESGYKVVPHSHPTLTLSTKRLKDDELLLSTFVHEQLHWYLEQHQTARDEAMQELRAVFPRIPVGYPEGSMTDEGNYEHLLVCSLEYQVDKALLGELRARQVMNFWATDHYTWIYKAVLVQGDKIAAVLRKYKLEPIEHPSSLPSVSGQ